MTEIDFAFFFSSVGERTSIFGSKITDDDEQDDSVNEEGVTAFNSGWLPGSDSTYHPLSNCLSAANTHIH